MVCAFQPPPTRRSASRGIVQRRLNRSARFLASSSPRLRGHGQCHAPSLERAATYRLNACMFGVFLALAADFPANAGVSPQQANERNRMDLKRISWDDLRIFLEVARNRTLSAAARQLGLDDSTVSRRIAQLEYRLGEALLERDHLGARPTTKGHSLLENVREMERAALALAEHMDDPAMPSGRVRLASMEGISTLYLSRQFVELRKRHPQLLIELVTSSSMVHVNRREADLLITFFPLEARSLEVMPVGEFRLHLYASADYLKTHGTPQNLNELSSHSFVCYIDDLVQLDTVRWLQEAVKQPQVVFQSTSMLSQMFSAASGAGLVMLPEFARASEVCGLVRVLPREVEVKRTLWLSVHRDLQYLRRVKTVMAFLREIFSRDYPCPPGIRFDT